MAKELDLIIKEKDNDKKILHSINMYQNVIHIMYLNNI